MFLNIRSLSNLTQVFLKLPLYSLHQKKNSGLKKRGRVGINVLPQLIVIRLFSDFNLFLIISNFFNFS